MKLEPWVYLLFMTISFLIAFFMSEFSHNPF